MRPHRHYEAAFAAWGRSRGHLVLPFNEARRNPAGDDVWTLKTPDFLVHGRNGSHWLAEVKGRRFIGGSWANWVTLDDVESLTDWRSRFGQNYSAALVFAYEIADGLELPLGTPDRVELGGKRYLFRAVEVGDYAAAMRPRSPRWKTVHLPAARFRQVVAPVSRLLADQVLGGVG